MSIKNIKNWQNYYFTCYMEVQEESMEVQEEITPNLIKEWPIDEKM